MKQTGTKTIPRVAALLVLLSSIVFSTGCASILTATFPPTSKVKEGQVITGEPDGYSYEVEKLKGNTFQLDKTPFCPELIERYKVEQKQLRGVWLAWTYIPALGLGYFDWIYADGIASASRHVTKTEEVPTGVRRKCGPKAVAANEEVFVQVPSLREFKSLQTNGRGKLDLAPITEQYQNFISLNLFVTRQDRLQYVSTLYVQ